MVSMKFRLFPKLDFFAYIKQIHVAYHPGRAKTEVARRLIMRMTAEETKRKFPDMKASWELLGYDAPTTVDVEMVTGEKKRFMAEHFSKYEMQTIIDEWQYKAHVEHMKEHNLEYKPDPKVEGGKEEDA